MATISSQLAFMNARRKTFTGNNDVYAPSRFVGTERANNDLSGIMGNLGFMAVSGSDEYFGAAYRESAQERITKYKQYFNFYKGDHWVNPWDDGERKPVVNFCSPIIDVTCDFFIARGFEIRAREGNEKVAEVLNLIWDSNDKLGLARKLMIAGQVFGDAYIYINLSSTDEQGNPLPDGKKKVRYTVVPPYFCYPLWEDLECKIMKAALIQYPVKTDGGSHGVYSILITKKDFRVFLNGKQQGAAQPNVFGEVNLVHYKNEAEAGMSFGKSDLEQIIPLNEDYNSVSHSIRRIIRYHAEPTTIIYGAKASRLEKGADKIWSGLPKPTEARVENLTFEADLSSCNTYLDKTESKIYAISQCPKQALYPPENISNVSAVALQTLFMPLLNKVARKRQAFTQVVKEVCRITRIIHERVLKEDLTELADHPENIDEIKVAYTSMLPIDDVAALDAATKRLAAGLSSKAAEMRKLHADLGDTERIALEIVADTVQSLAIKFEEAKALQGQAPDPTAAVLGSIAISEDFVKMADALKTISEEVSKEGDNTDGTET